MWPYNYRNVSELVGKTITSIDNSGSELVFNCSDGTAYKMYHEQDCCESVTIDDITGDLEDLLNTPILKAEESCSTGDQKDNYDDSCTWTYYKFATIKGYVDIRWYGTSNGYYSESVSFVELSDDKTV